MNVKYNTSLPEAHIKALKFQAWKEDCNDNEILKKAIETYLEGKEGYSVLIKEKEKQ